jgi:Lon protease-like protein
MSEIPVPEVIPVFPLPQTVLLPAEVLPLHIFEPRYKDMVRDALRTHRVIGMVEPMPGHESELAGRPPLRPVGCAGFIARHAALSDGRYLVWLVGFRKFTIEEELHSLTAYRQARIRPSPDTLTAEAEEAVRPLRLLLLASLPTLVSDTQEKVAQMMGELARVDDDQLVAVACHALRLPAHRKRELLEAGGILQRYLLLHGEVEEFLSSQPAVAPIRSRYVN